MIVKRVKLTDDTVLVDYQRVYQDTFGNGN